MVTEKQTKQGETMEDFRQNLLESIINSSNTINILNGTNIDHLTITGFMDIKELRKHENILFDRAEKIETTKGE